MDHAYSELMEAQKLLQETIEKIADNGREMTILRWKLETLMNKEAELSSLARVHQMKIESLTKTLDARKFKSQGEILEDILKSLFEE